MLIPSTFKAVSVASRAKLLTKCFSFTMTQTTNRLYVPTNSWYLSLLAFANLLKFLTKHEHTQRTAISQIKCNAWLKRKAFHLYFASF